MAVRERSVRKALSLSDRIRGCGEGRGREGVLTGGEEAGVGGSC